MRPTTATLGIRVTGSVTLRELYGARGAGIRAIAPPFGPHGTQAPFMSSSHRGWKRSGGSIPPGASAPRAPHPELERRERGL